MRRSTSVLLAAGLLAALAAPAGAQQRDGGWWPWAGGGWERAGDRDDRRDSRYERGPQKAKQGKGPPFCRNGQGHPVHGWRWCQEKGWAGDRGWDRYDRQGDYRREGDYRRDEGWGSIGWEDVILRRPRSYQPGSRYEGGVLGDVLGRVILGRLGGHADRIGARGPLDGRWLDLDGGGSVLQLRAGGVPLAELTDRNGDGRAELVLLRQGGR